LFKNKEGISLTNRKGWEMKEKYYYVSMELAFWSKDKKEAIRNFKKAVKDDVVYFRVEEKKLTN